MAKVMRAAPRARRGALRLGWTVEIENCDRLTSARHIEVGTDIGANPGTTLVNIVISKVQPTRFSAHHVPTVTAATRTLPCSLATIRSFTRSGINALEVGGLR